jgi:nickel-type superoxide dismutase maturation protease
VARLWRCAVSGTSMTPALDADDWLLVRTATADAIRPGDVVVVEQPDRPGFLLVKRAVRRTPDGWWVEGDNAAASDDSRLFGAVPDSHLRAKVLLRYWPRPRPVR